MERTAAIPGPNGSEVATWFQPTVLGWQLAAFFFVIAAGNVAWLTRSLSSTLLVAIGTASYSIYLVHEPIVSYFAVHGAPLAGALLAVAAGGAFWAIAERPFTAPSSKRLFTLHLHEPLRNHFSARDRCRSSRHLSRRVPAQSPRDPRPLTPDVIHRHKEHMRTHTTLTLFGALGAVGLSIAGCGGGGGGTSAVPAVTASPAVVTAAPSPTPGPIALSPVERHVHVNGRDGFRQGIGA